MTSTSAMRSLGLAVSVSLAAASSALAQPQNLEQTEIKINKVTDSFYSLDGSGGTIGVLTGPDGVLMVDSQYAALTGKIVAAIKTISDGRIRFLVDTHVHGDHTGGNENFGKLGVTILAREPLRSRLDETKSAPTAPRRADARPGLPVMTMKAR